MPAKIRIFRPKSGDVAGWNSQFCNRKVVSERRRSWAYGTPSKKSTRPVSSEYSAPTTTRPSFWMSCSRISEPCRRCPAETRTFARTASRTSASGSCRRLGAQQRLDRRTHAVDDRVQIPRLVDGRPLQLFDGGENRAALGVTEHHHEARAVAFRGELDAAHLRRRDDVACDADDEQIAEPLVEDDFRRHSRVRASEDDRERLLAAGDFRAPRFICQRLVAADIRHEPLVPVFQALKSVPGWHHRGVIVVRGRRGRHRDDGGGRDCRRLGQLRGSTIANAGDACRAARRLPVSLR